jgi:Calcium-activated chloride channel
MLPDRIRNYFGEGVAFYFAFLRTLTMALIFPTVIGVIHQYVLEPGFYTHLFLCVLYMLWAFAFNEVNNGNFSLRK